MNIAVIGGGICGLSCGYYLKKFSPQSTITLFEKEARIGGKIQTAISFGYTMEMAASMFAQEENGVHALAYDIGYNEDIIEVADTAHKRYIFDGDCLREIPLDRKTYRKTKLLSILQKIAIQKERFSKKRETDSHESLRAFALRKFGREATDTFFDILASHFYAGTPENLSVCAAFPELAQWEAKYGSILKAFSAMEKTNTSPLTQHMYGFRSGSESFMQKLSSSYAHTTNTQVEITDIRAVGSQWEVYTHEQSLGIFDKVILATPSYATAKIVKKIDAKLSDTLKTIEYAPLAVVSLGYETFDYPLDGAGVLTTTRSNTHILEVEWSSAIFPSHVQSTKGQLQRVFIGGQRQPQLAIKEDDELFQMATGGILETMGIYAEPLVKKSIKWYKALPCYGKNHLECVEDIEGDIKRYAGIHLCSSSYRGIRMNQCIRNAKETAMRIISE